jgi:hypothetical protein
MKYKIDNKISKRNIRKQGKSIIPLGLMINEFKRLEPRRGNLSEDNNDCKDVSLSEDGGY